MSSHSARSRHRLDMDILNKVPPFFQTLFRLAILLCSGTLLEHFEEINIMNDGSLRLFWGPEISLQRIFISQVFSGFFQS
ncbi:hypothetical protein KIN20_009356 [Parelaphostrongylus tenuis]|uniref:Uncharacterized protein n=1 Tax=Parelaphostrongylus tenuis TaxID=148309 RepID=A0AAD5MQE7_PARTN|nr:hypothetical protein KIN20_009356 [Parelaphostrongylus tenuis]